MLNEIKSTGNSKIRDLNHFVFILSLRDGCAEKCWFVMQMRIDGYRDFRRYQQLVLETKSEVLSSLRTRDQR